MIMTANTVNPASFLSGNTTEPIVCDCLQTTEEVYFNHQDLKGQPLEDTEVTWFVDGSSFICQGQHKVGYAFTTHQDITEANLLLTGTSAQKAEIIALTRDLELAKGFHDALPGPGKLLDWAAQGRRGHPVDVERWHSLQQLVSLSSCLGQDFPRALFGMGTFSWCHSHDFPWTAQ
uniref:RNase H type-1 domain-containing protein n=1 Tax=Gallus gallus TaxID=9031 RepID=A0A8V0XEW9_CHICK